MKIIHTRIDNRRENVMSESIKLVLGTLIIVALFINTKAFSEVTDLEPGDNCELLLQEVRRISTDDESEMLKTFQSIENRSTPVRDCKAYIAKQRYLDIDVNLNGSDLSFKRAEWHYILDNLIPSMPKLELLIRFYNKETETKNFLLKAISLIELDDKNAILFSDQENDYTGISPLELFFLNETGDIYKKYPQATKLLIEMFSQTKFRMRNDVFVPAAKSKIEQYQGTLIESYSIGYKKLLRHARNSSVLADF